MDSHDGNAHDNHYYYYHNPNTNHHTTPRDAFASLHSTEDGRPYDYRIRTALRGLDSVAIERFDDTAHTRLDHDSLAALAAALRCASQRGASGALYRLRLVVAPTWSDAQTAILAPPRRLHTGSAHAQRPAVPRRRRGGPKTEGEGHQALRPRAHHHPPSQTLHGATTTTTTRPVLPVAESFFVSESRAAFCFRSGDAPLFR